MLYLTMETIYTGGRPMTVPIERVETRILSIRGHRVMLDADPSIAAIRGRCYAHTTAGKEGRIMRTTAIKITPEDYILSVLTPEERLDAAFRVAEAAFKRTNLTMKDVENAVKTIRRKAYATKK